MTTFHSVDAGNGLMPDLGVEIDFTNDPSGATRTWTDVTTDVRQLSYALAGRNDVLQRTSPGSLTMLLGNASGDYDPSNASGSYYPGVRRMRWIRVKAKWGGVEYARWQGLITSWVVNWPEAGRDSTVSVTATDALKVLNLLDLEGQVFSAQRTDQRVTAVCNLAGISSSVTTGISSVVTSGTLAAQTNALAHLLDIEDTENGRLFADASGTIVFQDRHYRPLNSDVASGTIGDAAGEIPYQDVALTSDDANIWNEVFVTPSGGTAEEASDATSQTRHFTRSLSKSLLITSQIEALSAAQYLVMNYKDPSPKLPALTLLPVRGTAHWPAVLSAENSQRFKFRRRPAYGGTVDQDGFVEQISETIIPGMSWSTVLQMLPTNDQGGWVLGNSVNGLLGETTVLTY